MVLKKKQIIFYVFLSVLFCILFLGGFSGNCKAFSDSSTPNTSLDDTWLSTDSMIAIMENLKVETYVSGEVTFAEYATGYEEGTADYYTNSQLIAKNMADAFNSWFHTFSYNYDVTIGNICFYWGVSVNSNSSFSASKGLTFFFRSGSSIYISDFIPSMTFWYKMDNTLQFYRFSNWTYDSNNNKTGMATQGFSNNIFSLSQESVTLQNPSKLTQYRSYMNKDWYINISDESVYGTQSGYLTFNNEDRLEFLVAYDYRATSNSHDYNMGFITHKINLGSGDTPTPTPTGTGVPTPTGTGTPSGSDLTNIENGISNIQNSLTITPSGDDFISITSGDMLSALDLPAIDDPTANFWLSITDGLTTALTCPNNTSIQIPLIGATFTANSSDFELPDGDLKRLIRMACVVGFVLVEYKLIRKIIAYFSSGVFKQIFNAYSRMDISDLF